MYGYWRRCSAKFWKDPWIQGLENFKLIFDAPCEALEEALVGEFIFNNSWELSSADLWLMNDEIEAIKKIHNPMRSKPDTWRWVFASNGVYYVKIGYHVAKKLMENESNNTASSSFSIPETLWKNFWSLKVPNKVKHFIWRACNNTLPTKKQL